MGGNRLPPLVSDPAKRLELLGLEDHPESAVSMSLPIELLPQSQLDTSTILSEKNPWEKSHDVAIEIAATSNTLLQLKQYHGSLVQVKPAGKDASRTHLARLVVAPQDQPGFVDGTLYVSPLLSFNMGLNFHLETLIAGDTQDGSANKERTESGKQASTSQRNGLMALPPRKNVAPKPRVTTKPSISIKIEVSSLPQTTGDAKPSQEVPQAGCRPAKVAFAHEVAFSVIKEPILALLNSQTDMEPQEKDAAPKPPPGFPGAEEEKESKLPPFVGEGVPEEAYGPALIEWVRAKPRIVAEGDVVVIPVTEGTHRSGLLKTLYSDRAVRDLIYYWLTTLKPEGAKSALLISDSTTIKLEGHGQSAIPPGAPEYLVRSLQPSTNSPWPPEGNLEASEGETQAADVPIWKQVAAILAPAMHPARQGVTLRATVLLSGTAGSGKKTAIMKAAEEIGVRAIPFSCQELRAGSDPKTALALKMGFMEAKAFAPALMMLTDLESLVDKSPSAGGMGGLENGPARIAAALSECLLSNKELDKLVFVVGTTSSLPEVSAPIRRCFTHELVNEAPDLGGRKALLKKLLPKASGLTEKAVDAAALSTAGLLPADLRSAVADSVVAAVSRRVDMETFIKEATSDGKQTPKLAQNGKVTEVKLEDKDLEAALESVQKRTATAIGAPQIPNVKWEDVGGLEDVKGAILETVELPLKHPELFSSGLRRRSGLLLYGPPGTGKTLIAKAVATECSINFLSVKGPELINMYIGESERQVREVFERARRARPCVLFFDELDSLAPARGAGADSGGVMDRVVSQLLAEVDGLAGAGGLVSNAGGSQDVFLIGATNRPDLLDTALMRPGRLDKLLYVGVAQRPEDKLKVLQALTRKFVLSPSVVLNQIASSCPETLTGADLYALCADAWTAGLRRLTSSKDYNEDAEDVEVEHNDFELALANLTPSLSADELNRYQKLRQRYQSL